MFITGFRLSSLEHQSKETPIMVVSACDEDMNKCKRESDAMQLKQLTTDSSSILHVS